MLHTHLLPATRVFHALVLITMSMNNSSEDKQPDVSGGGEESDSQTCLRASAAAAAACDKHVADGSSIQQQASSSQTSSQSVSQTYMREPVTGSQSSASSQQSVNEVAGGSATGRNIRVLDPDLAAMREKMRNQHPRYKVALIKALMSHHPRRDLIVDYVGTGAKRERGKRTNAPIYGSQTTIPFHPRLVDDTKSMSMKRFPGIICPESVNRILFVGLIFRRYKSGRDGRDCLSAGGKQIQFP